VQTHNHTRRATRIALSGLLALLGLGLIATAAPPVSHDFNADGSDDYPVSVTGYDPAAPVNGAARMWSGASKSVIDTIVNTDTNTLFGWAIGSAGDLDADGHDDLIVGEPLWGPNGTLQGRIQVFSGDDSSVLLSATGLYAETGLGRYVAGIGDWNGDGIGDLAASGWDIADLDADGIGDDPIGIVFVISGADGSVLTEIFEPTATALFGYSVFGLGDITGDGLADLVVVDRGAEGVPGATGRLFIFAGQAQVGALSATDAHRTILNDDATLRGFAAHVDTMHPDLWLDEPTLQIISLTNNGTGGPNEAETTITIRKADGQFVGTKGVRPTLVLAGDINLDGKVDALDLQESIAQLGTNPQAAGVMPLADLNGDTIVDTHDVALLLDGYGDQTDIYEGLWDGSRLLATVGANAGFGSIGGGSIGGNWGVAPGRRPVDGCLRDMPDNNGPSLVQALLRQDGRINCNECPDCGFDDPLRCFKCSDKGSITGGEITATPEQPEPGDTVTFEWESFVVTGRKDKCGPPCDGDRECTLNDVPLGSTWFIDRKDPVTGEWIEGVKSKAAGHSPTVTDGACAEYRFRLISSEYPARNGCDPIPAETKQKEVQFADFEYKITCFADGSERTRLGVKEFANIALEPTGTTATWSYSSDGPGHIQVRDGGQRATFYAGLVDGQTTVTIESEGCTRKIVFTTVEPTGIRMMPTARRFHEQGYASAGFTWCVQVEPLDVSFRYIWVYEGTGNANATGGLSQWDGLPHQFEAYLSDVGCNNICEAEDGTYSGPVAPLPNGSWEEGEMTWDVPWYWKPTAGPSGSTGRQIVPTLGFYSKLHEDGRMHHKKGTFSVTIPADADSTGLPWNGNVCPNFTEPTSDVVPCN